MIFDARSMPNNQLIETEVCIVGAGAAGISIAREFVGLEFRVCLLESGGLSFEGDTQSLYEGSNIGLPYFPLDDCRLRYFGGTTNSWNGRGRPLEALDFEARDWVPHSGWPFGKSHLDPYYERAHTVCQLGPFDYDPGFWRDLDSTPPLPFIGDRVTNIIYQYSPPTRFGEVYRDEIAHADNISTYLHANAVDIETDETGQKVTRLCAATLGGNKLWVSAKLYILAASGIENARLLLASNKVRKEGLGNKNDLVGRFFMDHPLFFCGVLMLTKPDVSTEFYKRNIVNGTKVRATLTFAEEVFRREKMMNLTLDFNPWKGPEAESTGVRSVSHILKAIRQGRYPEDFWKHVRNAIADIDDVAIHSYEKLFGQPFPLYRFRARFEPTPNPDSRVTLVKDRDPLGMNRVQLDWRLNTTDKRGIRRALEILAEEVGRGGFGRVKIDLDDEDEGWPSSMTGQYHHMGTTRIHNDPKKGVVDKDCRLHGISNLYVTGSSVFPTFGFANPTLTIVALALRLADHIKEKVA
jgi:choline dehydrogenase-like flavoprotein